MVGDKRLTLSGILLRTPFYLLAFTMIIPYYWMVISAFKPIPELLKNPPSFILRGATLNNWWDATPFAANHTEGLFQRFPEVPLRFGQFFVNSVLITAVITALSLIVTSLAAYVIAKHRFPGRNVVFFIVLASMMIPWQVNFIPNYLTMKSFGWINTFQAYVIPALPQVVMFFFLRQYMMTIPNELIEAAHIDGASELRIWWQLILPLVGPALAAVSITSVLNNWNNFVWPLIIAQDSFHQTLPVALSRLNSMITSPGTMGVLMAGALVTSIPAVIVFLSFQRQFIESIAASGVKG